MGLFTARLVLLVWSTVSKQGMSVLTDREIKRWLARWRFPFGQNWGTWSNSTNICFKWVIQTPTKIGSLDGGHQRKPKNFWGDDSTYIHLPPKTNTTMENPPSMNEDVFPVEHGDFTMSCWLVYALIERLTSPNQDLKFYAEFNRMNIRL